MNRKGYTIAELAISLTILSVLVAISLGTLGKQNSDDKYKRTVEKIRYVEEQLINYYKRYGYLPCPAIGNTVEIASNFGISEAYNTATQECEGGLTHNTGMLPTRTLQIDDYYAYDAWDRKFTYRISKGMGAAETFSDDNYLGDIKIADLNGLEVTSTAKNPPNNYGAAYIIISHAANGDLYAWRRNNTATPSPPTTTVEYQNFNHNGTKVYIQNLKTYAFDDIISYKTKFAFLENKRGIAPIFMPKLTCSNAYFLTKNSITATAQISSALSTQIFNSAVATKKICDNPPNICNFKPSNINNLVVWWDASDPAATGTRPGAGAISALINKVDSVGPNLSQANGAFMPYFASTSVPQIETRTTPGMSFSSTQYLTSNSAGTTLTSVLANQNYTFFFMGKLLYNYNVIMPESGSCGALGTSYNNSFWLRYGDTTGGINNLKFSTCYHDVNINVEQYHMEDIPVIIGVRYSSTTLPAPNPLIGTYMYFLNKEGLFLDNHLTKLPTTPLNPMNYSGNSTGFRVAPDFLGEILIYNRALTDEEISQVNEYLVNRWFSNVCS